MHVHTLHILMSFLCTSMLLLHAVRVPALIGALRALIKRCKICRTGLV